MQEILKLKEEMKLQMGIIEKEGSRFINFLLSALLIASVILICLEVHNYGNNEIAAFETIEASYLYRGHLAEYVAYLEG